jgi:hypothetical protein
MSQDTRCSARQGKGQPGRAYLAIRLRDGGRDDFRVSLRLRVRDHPARLRASAHLVELTVTDRGRDFRGWMEGAKLATIRSAKRATIGLANRCERPPSGALDGAQPTGSFESDGVNK